MWELPACECSSDGEQECVYVCSGLSEDDFIVSTLEGRENKSDAYSSSHCAAADRIKLLDANWKAGRRAGSMLLETAQQPFETGLD